MNPRISVIIPYYEGERWLRLSAASVLRQTGVRLELIVVDDGSASPAAPVVSSFLDERVRHIRIAHSGKAAAVNKGLAEARGDVICVLDQDDAMAEGRLEKQLRSLDAHPDVGAVYSDYERVTATGERIYVRTARQASNKELLHAMASTRGMVVIVATLIRKAAVDRLGGFSEDKALTGADDGEFFARLIASGTPFLYVPGIAGQWVSHGDNYSKTAEYLRAQMVYLNKLENLCVEYPLIAGEMNVFRTKLYEMSGISLLERNSPAAAVSYLTKAVLAYPLNYNACYLLLKAVALTVLKFVSNRR